MVNQIKPLSSHLSHVPDEVKKAAKNRLYPSIFSAGYLELRRRRKRMEDFFSKLDANNSILDIGSQYSPYYPLFQNKCSNYITLDVVETPTVDIVATAEKIPLADDVMDIVICTQVLEHTDRPKKIVKELYRVLRPGGILLATVPSIFPQHGYPADNWRFMPDGLRLMMDDFSETQVIGEMDFSESWISVNLYYSKTIIWKLGSMRKVLEPIINLIGNSFAIALSFILKPITKEEFSAFSMNIWCEAIK